MTAVLIGAETYTREWVRYEIVQSHNQQMGLLGIYLNHIPDWQRNVEPRGPNPFDYVTLNRGILGEIPLSNIYPAYDWVYDDGYHNAATWIEQAALDAGR